MVHSAPRQKTGTPLTLRPKPSPSVSRSISIEGVASIVADIAAASSEQAEGLEQINKALSQMDEVTQQNSALVEENAATAKTLETQARAMDDKVAYFQIDEPQSSMRAVHEPKKSPAKPVAVVARRSAA